MSYETLDETEWGVGGAGVDLLEEGQVASARSAIEGLLARRPGIPISGWWMPRSRSRRGTRRARWSRCAAPSAPPIPRCSFTCARPPTTGWPSLAPARDDARRALAVSPDAPGDHALLARASRCWAILEPAEAHDRTRV